MFHDVAKYVYNAFTTLPFLRFLLSISVFPCALASRITANIVFLVTPQMQIASCTPCGPMFLITKQGTRCFVRNLRISSLVFRNFHLSWKKSEQLFNPDRSVTS